MKKLDASRRLDSLQILTLATGVFAAGLLMFANSLVAQNNDNGGILPSMPSGPSKTSQSTTDNTLATDGQMEGTTVTATMGVLGVASDDDAAVGIAVGVSPDEAEFHSTSPLVAQQMPDGGLQLQGSGTLNPEIGLHLHLQAPTQFAYRAAILVGDDGSHPLADLLSGKAKPFAAVALGNLPGLDLTTFDQMLQKHAGAVSPFRATVVIVSVDVAGNLHLAAVAGRTDGGPLELSFK